MDLEVPEILRNGRCRTHAEKCDNRTSRHETSLLTLLSAKTFSALRQTPHECSGAGKSPIGSPELDRGAPGAKRGLDCVPEPCILQSERRRVFHLYGRFEPSSVIAHQPPTDGRVEKSVGYGLPLVSGTQGQNSPLPVHQARHGTSRRRR